jgi:hypothetical protein
MFSGKEAAFEDINILLIRQLAGLKIDKRKGGERK